jgi:hypothetical protein
MTSSYFTKYFCDIYFEYITEIVDEDTYNRVHNRDDSACPYRGRHRLILPQDGRRISPEIESHSDKIKSYN